MRSLVLVGFLASCSFEHSVAPSLFDDAATSASDAPRTPTDAAMVTSDAAADAPPSSTISCPGVACGAVCCVGACAAGTCAGDVYSCDGPEDCSGNDVCCNDQNGSSCSSTCYGEERSTACHTTADCGWDCDECTFSSGYGQKVCCGDGD
jgi:hypothetical protein